jgi:hypothetical protein
MAVSFSFDIAKWVVNNEAKARQRFKEAGYTFEEIALFIEYAKEWVRTGKEPKLLLPARAREMAGTTVVPPPTVVTPPPTPAPKGYITIQEIKYPEFYTFRGYRSEVTAQITMSKAPMSVGIGEYTGEAQKAITNAWRTVAVDAFKKAVAQKGGKLLYLKLLEDTSPTSVNRYQITLWSTETSPFPWTAVIVLAMFIAGFAALSWNIVWMADHVGHNIVQPITKAIEKVAEKAPLALTFGTLGFVVIGSIVLYLLVRKKKPKEERVEAAV